MPEPTPPTKPRTPATDHDEPLLRVDGLETHFHAEGGTVRAVDGVSFTVDRGETVCLVGESGSGKTAVCESITRLLAEPPGEIVAGRVSLDGRDILSLSPSELRALRGNRVAHVFQNPQSAFNPVYTIGWQLREAIRLHSDRSKSEASERATELLEHVGLPNPARRLDDHPHELSGGQAQRVAIAMALAGEPELLIADEPTTALDVTVQAQVLDVLDDVQSAFGMGVLFVTHDLAVVASIADRVVVLRDGRVVEQGDVVDIFEQPSHSYTQQLLDATPGRRSRIGDDGDGSEGDGDDESGEGESE